MAIPQTYLTALLLLILTMICWGSWANTLKRTGPKWRYELFYYDFALGVMLTGIIAAITFGSYGSSDITFMDNMSIIRRKQIAFAAGAGVLFNLANMLLAGAISIAGISVAFPIGMGVALVTGVLWSFILRPQGNAGLQFAGSGIVVIAIILTSMAYRLMIRKRELDELQKIATGQAKKKKPLKPSRWKAIVLSLVSGALLGSSYPLIESARVDDLEMGAYSIGFVFGIAVFLSTIVFNFFFVNLPVQGQPVPITAYANISGKQHLVGVLGGLVWMTGAIASFAAATAPKEVQVSPAISQALGQSACLVGMLWGLLYWKEFADTPDRARMLMGSTVALYLIGLGLISIAPLYVTK